MNPDTNRVVKLIKQLIQLSLGEVTDFQLGTRALDKQLQNSQIACHISTTQINKTTWHNVHWVQHKTASALL